MEDAYIHGRLRARVTKEEMRLMAEAAERRALSVTEWVRQTLMLEARRVLRIPVKPRSEE
jgi:uncharacterized protein (DUF1778 family)